MQKLGILVVEDEAVVRQLTRAILEWEGWRVFEAEDSAAALEQMERFGHEISVVVTDLLIPGKLDGLRLGQLLTTRYPRLRVLYTSGLSELPEEPKVKRQSRAAFLPKPFAPKKLREAVRKLAGMATAAGEAEAPHRRYEVPRGHAGH